MGNIRVLPETLVNQIAAGEVIERPAFAVKELIENAIDAKASSISIDIVDSGLTRIKVTDNGKGMDKEDLELSIRSHATSKLADETLTHINTMGFRGEALASIASISHLTIQSRVNTAPAGHQISIVQGKIDKSIPVGIAQGTIVECEGLFSPVPARKKFLKSPQTEFRHIVDIVTGLALAYPEIRFELTHNGRPYLITAQTNLYQRITDTLGLTIAKQMIPISEEESYITLEGFIGTPTLTTASANKIWLSINKRPVTDKLITLAIKEAYASLIDPHLFPIVVLNLTVPFELIDVNVHPKKQEIRFVDARFIFDTVKGAIFQTLQSNNLTFGKEVWQPKETSAPLATTLKQEVLTNNPLAKTQTTVNNLILQIHNSYLVIQTSDGLLLIDQHAAHERVLYEQFKTAYLNKLFHPKYIDTQISLTLSPSDILILEEYLPLLEKMGIVFSKDLSKIVITSIPEVFEKRDIESLIKEILAKLHHDIPISGVDLKTEDLIHFLSCKAAIKAGDPLTQDQMQELYRELSLCNLPYTCPHGRPTHIHLGLEEIKKLFKRI